MVEVKPWRSKMPASVKCVSVALKEATQFPARTKPKLIQVLETGISRL